MTSPVILDGLTLTIDDVVRVARQHERVALAPMARSHLDRVRAHVERLAAGAEAVYGVNTGFGKLSDVAIPIDKLSELQVNLVRSHAAGVGQPLPEDEVRAVMLLRANVLSRGHSGIRSDVVELILGMLNAGLWPEIPEQGSVGASGDLAPLAHLALGVIGEGIVRDRAGHADTGSAALATAGLAAARLGAKEGLALINGTQAHTAITALALHDAINLWLTAHVAGAATLDALLGTPTAFDDRIHAVRGQRGQVKSAALFRSLVANSAIRESHRSGDPRVQDAYALRCMPQVHGPVVDALEFARGIVERELNAATDNPLVFDDGTMVSGGNFHGYAVGMVADLLAMTLTSLAGMSERRVDRLVNPDLNQGLPAFLTPNPGLNSGYMMAQVTAAALTSECKGLSHPASVDTIPTDGGKEDVVPMAMGAALKLRRVVANVRHVLAVELLCAMQGLEFRRPLTSSPAVERAREIVREVVPPLTVDRPVAPDLASISTLITHGSFARIARDHGHDV